MTLPLVWFNIAARVTVALCWLVLVGALLLRRKPWRDRARKRDRASMIGFALHVVAFGLVLFMRRERLTPLLPLGKPGEISLAVVSMALALGSIWITLAALRRLSRQWGVAARLVEGHTLVTEGPYRAVRHPIYLGNFALLVATGLAFSRIQPLLIAILVFWIGTALRMRKEEKLLREAFGQEFEDYARRVPALFPRLC